MAKKFDSKVTTATPTTAGAGLGLPHGAAPTAPSDGDVWTTSTGLYARINGVTVGPLAAAGAGGLSPELFAFAAAQG